MHYSLVTLIICILIHIRIVGLLVFPFPCQTDFLSKWYFLASFYIRKNKQDPNLSKLLNVLYLFQIVVKLFVTIFIFFFSFAGGGRELKGITSSKLVSAPS